MTGAGRAVIVGIGPVRPPAAGSAARVPAPDPGMMVDLERVDDARTIPSCANMDAARMGADPELAASLTGAELRFSLGRSELARIRIPRPSATKAMTSP